MEYTKGEWVLTQDGEANFFGVALIGTHNKWLMRIQQNGELQPSEQEANVKLMVCSKELLEALIDCKELIMQLKDERSEYYDSGLKTKITDAINKVTK
jgi:hypothetical protein